jgi:hypothetical protein
LLLLLLLLLVPPLLLLLRARDYPYGLRRWAIRGQWLAREGLEQQQLGGRR